MLVITQRASTFILMRSFGLDVSVFSDPNLSYLTISPIFWFAVQLVSHPSLLWLLCVTGLKCCRFPVWARKHTVSINGLWPLQGTARTKFSPRSTRINRRDATHYFSPLSVIPPPPTASLFRMQKRVAMETPGSSALSFSHKLHLRINIM